MKAFRGLAMAAGFAAIAGGMDPEAQALLRRATEKIAVNDHSVQNYTCMQTVQREFYRPAASVLVRPCSTILELRANPTPDMALRRISSDRLRLEVVNTEKGELFAWPGSSRFEERGIEGIVSHGPLATGAFGAMLGVVFLKDAAAFNFIHDTEWEGKRVKEFSFEVSRENSHYTVQLVSAKGWYKCAYSGVVWIDTQTADPVRIVLTTGELPAATDSCQTVASLEFSRVPIGSSELLLPHRAAQRFIGVIGNEAENTTTFSDCREYSSESTVHYFHEPAAERAADGSKLRRERRPIPSGLLFQLELLTPIDSETAAAGDRFTAKLVEPLRDLKTTYAPKGAIVDGRITLLKMFHIPSDSVAVGLTPATIEIDGEKIPFAAVANTYRPGAAKRPFDIVLPPPGDYSGGFVTDWRTEHRW